MGREVDPLIRDEFGRPIGTKSPDQIEAEQAQLDAEDAAGMSLAPVFGPGPTNTRVDESAAPPPAQPWEEFAAGLATQKPHEFDLGETLLRPPAPPLHTIAGTTPEYDPISAETYGQFDRLTPPLVEGDPNLQYRMPAMHADDALAQAQAEREAGEKLAGVEESGLLNPYNLNPSDDFQETEVTPESMDEQYARTKEDDFRLKSKERQANNINRLATLFSSILPPGLVAKVATGVSGLWADIEDGYRRAANTAEEATLATQKPLQDRFAAEEKYLGETADSIDQNMEDLFTRSANRLAQIAEIDQEIQAGRIDPRQAWEDKGTAANVLGALGSGLYRFLQVGQGGVGGANPVVQVFENSLQRDLQAQAANLDKLFEQRGHLRQDALDDERMVELKNAALAKSAMYRISGAVAALQKELAGDHLSLKARQEKEALIAALQERGAAFMLDAFGGIAKYHMASLKKRGKGGGGSGIFGDGSTPYTVEAVGPGEINLSFAGIDFGMGPDGEPITVLDFQDKQIAQEDRGKLIANTAQRQALANIAAIGFGRRIIGNKERELINQQLNIIYKSWIQEGGRAISDRDLEAIKDAILGKGDPSALIIRWVSDGTLQDKLDAANTEARKQIKNILGSKLKPKTLKRMRLSPMQENISHLLGPSPEEGARMKYEEIENQSRLADEPRTQLSMAKEFHAFIRKANDDEDLQFTTGSAPLLKLYREQLADMVINNPEGKWDRFIPQMRSTIKKIEAELKRADKIHRGEEDEKNRKRKDDRYGYRLKDIPEVK